MTQRIAYPTYHGRAKERLILYIPQAIRKLLGLTNATRFKFGTTTDGRLIIEQLTTQQKDGAAE